MERISYLFRTYLQLISHLKLSGYRYGQVIKKAWFSEVIPKTMLLFVSNRDIISEELSPLLRHPIHIRHTHLHR